MSFANLAGKQVSPPTPAKSKERSMSRQQRSKSVTMLKISDNDLRRHEVIAYEDGYADARDYGQDGFWLNPEYGAYARERYLMGFKKGLRVYKVTVR